MKLRLVPIAALALMPCAAWPISATITVTWLLPQETGVLPSAISARPTLVRSPPEPRQRGSRTAPRTMTLPT
jgi:hypothetical protein